jgi:uncharacterized protein YjbI with pentapeptide repeats
MTDPNLDLPKILADHAAWLRGDGGRRAGLQGAYLQRAYLRGADLRGAYLQGADLQGADLQGADLQGACLRGAYLRGAYLRGAYLRGADLRGADLQGAGLQGADLQGAKYDGHGIMSIASVAFTGHGERGRTLVGIRHTGGIVLRCGCFNGSPDDLRAYIANGAEKYRPSRTAALEAMLTILAIERAE